MSLSMHQASVTAFTKSLSNLKAILEKAKAHALDHKIEESVYVDGAAVPGHAAAARQVQIATDIARGGAARLAGVEPPVYEDNEKTFDDLAARIQRTLDYMAGLDASRRSRTRRRGRSRGPFAGNRTRSPVRTTCSSSRCRTCTSTRRRPTGSCGITACRWARPTSSGIWIRCCDDGKSYK